MNNPNPASAPVPSDATSCGCWFHERAPRAHDALLGIEALPVPEALSLVCRLLDLDDPDLDGIALFDDPDDFGRFVGVHNWSDPVAMYEVGQHADVVLGLSWAEIYRRSSEFVASTDRAATT